MTWNGDISGMGQLAKRVEDLSRVPSRAARRVAADLENLIGEEFDAGADPYGNAWEPLAPATLDRGRTPPPLTDTHAMRDSVSVAPLARAGVGVTIAHPAAPHQTGWVGPQGEGPARPILPSGVMPARWNEAIRTAIVEELRR